MSKWAIILAGGEGEQLKSFVQYQVVSDGGEVFAEIADNLVPTDVFSQHNTQKERQSNAKL